MKGCTGKCVVLNGQGSSCDLEQDIPTECNRFGLTLDSSEWIREIVAKKTIVNKTKGKLNE